MGIDIDVCVMHRLRPMTPEQIKSLRESREWSQQQLADQLGVDQGTVSRIERGVAEPSKSARLLLERIAAEPRAEQAA